LSPAAFAVHLTSSLPGLTRQSILFERVLRSVMDTRVKPAYDGFWRIVIQTSFTLPRPQAAALMAP
jgi:hypothetical protein